MLADDHSHHDHTANLVASPSVASEAVYPSSQGQAAAVDPNLYYNNYQQVHTQTTIISKICVINKISITSRIYRVDQKKCVLKKQKSAMVGVF